MLCHQYLIQHLSRVMGRFRRGLETNLGGACFCLCQWQTISKNRMLDRSIPILSTDEKNILAALLIGAFAAGARNRMSCGSLMFGDVPRRAAKPSSAL